MLEIHTTLLQEFGGPPGVRDLGLLESALFRPRTGYYADLIEMAAALFESLLMNHPFVDGKKRVAFFAADVFLRVNGFHTEVEADGGMLLRSKGESTAFAIESVSLSAAPPLRLRPEGSYLTPRAVKTTTANHSQQVTTTT